MSEVFMKNKSQEGSAGEDRRGVCHSDEIAESTDFKKYLFLQFSEFMHSFCMKSHYGDQCGLCVCSRSIRTTRPCGPRSGSGSFQQGKIISVHSLLLREVVWHS